MIKAKRLGHATFSTPDIERQVEYWTRVMGLRLVERGKDRAVLATRLGQEAVVLEAGDHADLTRIAFQVSSGRDLSELARGLNAEGIASQRISDLTPGVSEALSCTDPKGTSVDIYTDFRFHPHDKTEGGIDPLKIGHVASRVHDVAKIAEFYEKILGFQVSDWMGDHFVFMRCGADHHTVNFTRYETQRLHHVAFEVRDWAEIQRSCEVLSRNDIELVWGPLRHIVGHNVAAYHRNSDDLRIECYCEMDRMVDEELGYWEPRPWHEEVPLRPKRWPKETLRSAWGFGSYGKFPGYP